MQRWLFRRELERLAPTAVFYLDPAARDGVDHRLYRESGRTPRGERIYQEVAGARRERTSIISASQQGKLVAPRVFQDSCNTEVVDTCFEKGLFPVLPPGSVIVLDTHGFINPRRRSGWWRQPAVTCCFCRPARPDLNPIEHLRAAFKTRLRQGLPTAANSFLFIANMGQYYC